MQFTLLNTESLDFSKLDHMSVEEILELPGDKLMELVLGDKKNAFKVVKEKDMFSNTYSQDEKVAMLMCKMSQMEDLKNNSQSQKNVNSAKQE